MAKGRGRLTSFDLLPEVCAPVVAWASNELRDREKLQIEIYADFHAQLEAIKKEHRGELQFDIPSFSSFNRLSTRQATMTRRLNQTREITGVLAEKFDAGASDDLTLIAGEAIKTLIFELLTDAGEGGMAAKDAMNLANALRSASQAQGISTARRQTVEAQFAKGVNEAVDKVAKVKGLTNDTIEAIKSQILGVAA